MNPSDYLHLIYLMDMRNYYLANGFKATALFYDNWAYCYARMVGLNPMIEPDTHRDSNEYLDEMSIHSLFPYPSTLITKS